MVVWIMIYNKEKSGIIKVELKKNHIKSSVNVLKLRGNMHTNKISCQTHKPALHLIGGKIIFIQVKVNNKYHNKRINK